MKKFPSFTLDANCMYDLDVREGQPLRKNAPYIRQLLDLQFSNNIRIGLVGSIASEKQEGDIYLDNFSKFDERRKKLGFGKCELLPCVGMWNVTFWGNSLWSSEETEKREYEIFKCMFPTKLFEWADIAEANEIQPENTDNVVYRKWRNERLDAKAFWAYEHAGFDHFVTNDDKFFRLNNGFGERNDYVIRPSDIPQYI